MPTVSWVKSTTGEWLDLERVNLTSVTATGVYIIWHGGSNPRVVYVGQGDVADRLSSHRGDRRILAYKNQGLYVTWAAVDRQSLDGVERYLADKWNPLVGDAHPNVIALAVNSPWG